MKPPFRPLSLCLPICILVLAGLSADADAQLRIVNYNVAQLNGVTTDLQAVFAALNDDDKPGFAVAPALYVMQEVQTTDRLVIQNLLNAAAPVGVTYALGSFSSSGGEDGSGGAQAMYYRSDLLAEVVAAHQDIPTGAGRNADRWKLHVLGYDSPAADFYIYSMHLKAGSAQSDIDERLSGAIAVRNNADALPEGTNIIYAGDFNLSSNIEAAYLEFLSAGPGQAVDPLGSGSWTGMSNALKHTQAPCLTGCSLVGGGMDDRFDFQLSSGEMNDSEGLARMTGTYRAFGNDGQHYNQAINNGNNFYYPADLPTSNALADALFDASDHIPVIVEYQIPAVMAGSLPADYGRVIQNTLFEIELLVSNDAEVMVPVGGDELDYTASAFGGISGVVNGAVPAGGSPDSVLFELNTSVTGQIAGLVLLDTTSQAAQVLDDNLFTTGTVLRPSNASLAADADLDGHIVELTLAPDSGVHAIGVPVHNFGFDSLQALLDVDAVSPIAAPFAFTGGLASGIGADPAVLSFEIDTAGLDPGDYSANVLITVSDEDVAGAQAGLLALVLDVTIGQIGNPADINNDGVVDPVDLALVLGNWGSCAGCPADVNGDGAVDPTDLALVLGNWGPA